MDARLISQPYADNSSLGQFVERLGALPGLTEGIFVVAWAKRSGLNQIKPSIDLMRTGGAQIRLIVGIDQGGATRQGLEVALSMFNSVHVFHDPSGRTFHPKLYWGRATAEALLFVGSNNLTAGGIRSNYEAALECSLDIGIEHDARLHDDVRAYIARLLADGEVCKPLCESLLVTLLADPRFAISDEDASPASNRWCRDGPSSEPVFGRSAEKKTARPAATQPPGDTEEQEPAGAGQAVKVSAPAPPRTRIVYAVLRPPCGGAFVQEVNAFGRTTPPHDGFKSDWQPAIGPSRRRHRLATILSIRSFRRRKLVGDRDRGRNARGGGYTVLRDGRIQLHRFDQPDRELRRLPRGWSEQCADGPALGDLLPMLRATDYSDSFVVIERHADGSFRLSITPTQPPGYL